jgi:hypothetical protein
MPDSRKERIGFTLWCCFYLFLIRIEQPCLNRPFDDQSQNRIRLESEAILIIINRLHSKEWE